MLSYFPEPARPSHRPPDASSWKGGNSTSSGEMPDIAPRWRAPPDGCRFTPLQHHPAACRIFFPKPMPMCSVTSLMFLVIYNRAFGTGCGRLYHVVKAIGVPASRILFFRRPPKYRTGAAYGHCPFHVTSPTILQRRSPRSELGVFYTCLCRFVDALAAILAARNVAQDN